MSRYLQECDVQQVELAVPFEDEAALLAFFDGSDRAGCACARASRQGASLKIESGSGKILFQAREGHFAVEEIRLFEDREGDFFHDVVLALVVTYRGTLKCRLSWCGARAGRWEEELAVESGVCTPPVDLVAGRWLFAAAIDESDEAIELKLAEARRLFDEYQRLKLGKRLLPGP